MELSGLIQLALNEDLPSGDLTTEGLSIKSKIGFAQLIAKEDLILSGSDLFTKTMLSVDPSLEIKFFFKDSETLLKKQTTASIKGNLISIIKAERTALNFIGRLSGIATLTRCYVNQVKHTKCQILDTRKTIPLYRDLEKKAVLDGGGTNHRRDLSSAILIKENHIYIAGDITSAIRSIRKKTNKLIMVETKNSNDISEALKENADWIMLDNMSNNQITHAIELINSRAKIEASGNMTIDRVKSVAELGVDYISVGALTHSAPCADFSLLMS